MSTVHAVCFEIVVADPHAHLFTVTCRIAQADPEGQVVSMAAWIPGSYMIRDFAKNIVTMQASCNGQQLGLAKTDKQTWQVEPCVGELVLTYDVYAWDLSVRSAHLDTTHAYFNGTSIFLRVHGQDQSPQALTIKTSSHAALQSWQVATAMPKQSVDANGFGQYLAQDYDELIDHPVEMGTFDRISFEACGVVHEVVITGQHRTDMQRLANDLKTICEHHIKFFGQPAPMDYYLFQVMVVGNGYGGLEHRASTSLLCSRQDLPRKEMKKIDTAYRNFLALCSHEYLHTWNVKRIKPAVFLPYDLTQEVHTELLWFFEGITSYYDELALYRCGVIDEKNYLEMLGQGLSRVYRGQGRFKQSLAESSFDAWTKFYKQDENAPNAICSYYTKGAMAALMLDLFIRQQSQNQKSLDDVMRYLWRNFALKQTGLEEKQVADIIQQATGIDCSALLQTLLYETQDPDLSALLRDFGYDLKFRAPMNAEDMGGTPAKPDQAPLLSLGARWSRAEGGAAGLTMVFDQGAAQAAGLSAGDVIIAVDDLKVGADSLDKIVNTYTEGETIKVHAFRRDELMLFEVKLQTAVADCCYLQALGDQAESALDWL